MCTSDVFSLGFFVLNSHSPERNELAELAAAAIPDYVWGHETKAAQSHLGPLLFKFPRVSLF